MEGVDISEDSETLAATYTGFTLDSLKRVRLRGYNMLNAVYQYSALHDVLRRPSLRPSRSRPVGRPTNRRGSARSPPRSSEFTIRFAEGGVQTIRDFRVVGPDVAIDYARMLSLGARSPSRVAARFLEGLTDFPVIAPDPDDRVLVGGVGKYVFSLGKPS